MSKKPRILNKTQKNSVQSHGYGYKSRWLNHVDSHEELRMIRAYDFDDNIITYVVQPKSYFYTIDDNGNYHYDPTEKGHRYTPDVALKPKFGQSYLGEVKLESAVESLVFKTHFQQLQNLVRDVDQTELRLITTKTYPDVYRDNCDLLHPYLSLEVTENERRLVSDIQKAITFAELKTRSESLGLSLISAFALVAHKVLAFDMHTPLTDHTILEV